MNLYQSFTEGQQWFSYHSRYFSYRPFIYQFRFKKISDVPAGGKAILWAKLHRTSMSDEEVKSLLSASCLRSDLNPPKASPSPLPLPGEPLKFGCDIYIIEFVLKNEI